MTKSTRGNLLVTDDELELMRALGDSLGENGFAVRGVTTPAEALTLLRDGEFDLLLTDLMMPGTDGITLLKQALEIDPNLVGIIMTGQGTIQTAVEAMKSGAFDYVLKPFRLQHVLPILDRAMAVRAYLHDQHNIALSRIEVISYGETKPVADNKTRDGRAQNRRVVIKVVE